MVFCYNSTTGLRPVNNFLGVVGSYQDWIQANDKAGGLSLNLVCSFLSSLLSLDLLAQFPQCLDV